MRAGVSMGQQEHVMYIKQRAAPGHRQSSQYISYYHSRRCGKQQVKSPTKAFSFLAAQTSTVFGYSQLCTCWPAWWRPPCSRTPWPRCPGWRAATTPRWPPCPARGSRVADRSETRVLCNCATCNSAPCLRWTADTTETRTLAARPSTCAQTPGPSSCPR